MNFFKKDTPQGKDRPKDSDIDLTSAETILKSVQKRNIFGKLEKGATVGGKEISKSGGYYDHGPDNIENDTTFFTAINPLRKAIDGDGSTFKDNDDTFLNSHFVFLRKTKDGNMSLVYYFSQDSRAADSRQQYTEAFAQFQLTPQNAEKLLGHIRTNPDVIDQIYKQAYPDTEPETVQGKGIKRKKAESLFILDNNDVQKLVLSDAQGAKKVRETLKDIGSQKYTQPHGIS